MPFPIDAQTATAATESYIALARRLSPDATPEQTADLARRLAEADVLGLLWRFRENVIDPKGADATDYKISQTIDQCRQQETAK